MNHAARRDHDPAGAAQRFARVPPPGARRVPLGPRRVQELVALPCTALGPGPGPGQNFEIGRV